MEEKLKALCEKITAEGQEMLRKRNLSCEVNLQYAIAHFHLGKKYARVDVGGSGRYMVTQEGEIFGIKAYGVIHRGHAYGNLDTINDFWWGDYTAKRIK